MKRTDLPEHLQELLQHICFATISTVCPGGQPWGTPMVVKFDDDLNMYWVTNKFSRHLHNLEHEPRMFATVYDSSLPNGDPAIDALYVEMTGEVLATPEAITEARQRSGIHFSENLPDHESFLGDCPRRFAKASFVKAWHNVEIDSDGHTIDAREELPTLA